MTESPKARQAWADYVALGPGRSLEKLLNRYRNDPNPPTTRLSTLKGWSVKHRWQQRLQDLADEEVRLAQERQAEHIREILETGFALPHERVQVLKHLGEKLFRELTAAGDDNRLWVSEPKMIGFGESAQYVEIERFNKAEVEQFRLILDDLAKETGGRIRKTELSGPNGEPIDIRKSVDLSGLSDDELDLLEGLAERAAQSGEDSSGEGTT